MRNKNQKNQRYLFLQCLDAQENYETNLKLWPTVHLGALLSLLPAAWRLSAFFGLVKWIESGRSLLSRIFATRSFNWLLYLSLTTRAFAFPLLLWSFKKTDVVTSVYKNLSEWTDPLSSKIQKKPAWHPFFCLCKRDDGKAYCLVLMTLTYSRTHLLPMGANRKKIQFLLQFLGPFSFYFKWILNLFVLVNCYRPSSGLL